MLVSLMEKDLLGGTLKTSHGFSVRAPEKLLGIAAIGMGKLKFGVYKKGHETLLNQRSVCSFEIKFEQKHLVNPYFTINKKNPF